MYLIPCFQHPTLQWHVCCNWWPFFNTSFSKFMVYITTYPWCFTFDGFWQMEMTCVHHCSSTGNSFTAYSILPSPSPHLQPLAAFFFSSLSPWFYFKPFPECYIVGILQYQAFSVWFLQSILKRSVLGVHWKDWCLSWNSSTLATWCRVDSLEKDPDAGRDWGQEEKGTTEDEMAGWHHRLDGREFEWTPGVGDGWGGLVCCDSWGFKESDTTERLNWTELKVPICIFIAW